MEQSVKKHVIFDFGAVLFEWQPAVLMARLLPHRAVDAAAIAQLQQDFFLGYGGEWNRFDRGTIEPPELVAAIAARSGLSPQEVQGVVDAIPGELHPIEDTVAWLHRLHAAGHRLFYLSNMPRPFADHLERTHAFLSLFESGVFSGRVQLGKPDRAVFELALQRFGVEAADCVFLDDHLVNVEVARTVGMSAVPFTDAAQARADLRALGLDLAD